MHINRCLITWSSQVPSYNSSKIRTAQYERARSTTCAHMIIGWILEIRRGHLYHFD